MNHDKLNKTLKFRREILNAKEAGKFFSDCLELAREIFRLPVPGEKKFFEDPGPGRIQIFTSADGVPEFSTSMSAQKFSGMVPILMHEVD